MAYDNKLPDEELLPAPDIIVSGIDELRSYGGKPDAAW